MKKFLIGFISGAVLCGSLAVVAVEYNIYPNPYKVMVDGKETAIEGYNINDKSYFQLRDIGSAVGFQVGFDAANETVLVSTDPTAVMPDENADPAPTESTEPTNTPNTPAPLPEGADKTEPFLNADNNYVIPRSATSYFVIPEIDLDKYFRGHRVRTDNGIPVNYSEADRQGKVTLTIDASTLETALKNRGYTQVTLFVTTGQLFCDGEEVLKIPMVENSSFMTLKNYYNYVAPWIDSLRS